MRDCFFKILHSTNINLDIFVIAATIAMPAAISQETRDTVKKRLEDGVKTRDIAAEFNFSISKVSKGIFNLVLLLLAPRLSHAITD